MTNKKIFVAISVILIYVVLFGLFFYFTQNVHGCSYKSTCIHFCSSNSENYTDDYLLDQFKESKSAMKSVKKFTEDEIDKVKFKAIRGIPSCGKMVFLEPNDEVNSTKPPYEFSYVSKI